MREAAVNIAIRWFVGYGLHERLPDHSNLTHIRQRWGEARFHKIFQRTASACLEAKIATAEVVHIDASLIRAPAIWANVIWESLVKRHATDVINANRADEGIETEKKSRQSGQHKKASLTDPVARMAPPIVAVITRNKRLEPATSSTARSTIFEA